DRGDVGDRGAFVERRLDFHLRIECAEDGGRDRDAADDAGLFEQELSLAAGVLGHEGEGGRIARADVLGQRSGGDAFDVVPCQLHCSSTGSWSGRTTKCPASAWLSTGKSSRKWTPRLSSRASPPTA